jgi:hypothetical protein
MAVRKNPAPAEPISERPSREDERGEEEGVGLDDPLRAVPRLRGATGSLEGRR